MDTSLVSPKEQEHVDDVLHQLRVRNAVAVAWIRFAAYGLGFVMFLGARLRGVELAGLAAGPASILTGTHTAVAVGLLVWLHRRPSRSAILAGAITDLVFVSLAAALTAPADGQAAHSLVLYVILLQLLLLFDALTVGTRALEQLSAASWMLVAAVAVYRRIGLLDAVVDLLVLGLFGATIALVGARYLAIAVRLASQEWVATATEMHARELQAANAALRAAQAEARDLTSLTVHDLRNPLTSVWANLEDAREQLPEMAGGAREAIDVAVEGLRRVNDLIGDLLVVTRLENEDRHEPATVPIDQLLAEVERGSSPLVRRAGARLERRRVGGAPSMLRAEPALVRRMLDNLVANAARHVGPGDRVEVAVEPADDNRVRLAVRNTGPPVSPDIRQRLFEKHASTARRGAHNVGLGLYMCKLVAERHGGSIALVERQGWNVSFEVMLPAG